LRERRKLGVGFRGRFFFVSFFWRIKRKKKENFEARITRMEYFHHTKAKRKESPSLKILMFFIKFTNQLNNEMKKLIPILLFFSAQLIYSQNVTVNCHFVSTIKDSCSIRPDKYYIKDFEPVYKSFIKGDQCSFNFTIEKPGIVQFMYNNQSANIWLEPGYNLTLTISNDSLYKAITVEGANATQNAFLRSFYLTFKDAFDKPTVKQKILTSTADAFEMSIFNERKKQTEFINSYKDKEKFSASFSSFISNLIKYTYFSKLISYPIITANENKGLTVNPLPEILLENVNAALANNDDALNCEAYRSFLSYYIIYNTSKLNNFNKFTNNSTSMEMKMGFCNQTIQGKSNIYCIANYLNENVALVSPYTAKHIYGLLSTNEKNGEYSKLLKTKCEQQIKSKEVVTVTSAENKTGDVKILGSDGKYFTLNDFKGKVVYVDYWASWCGPCRQQFPYSKELHKKFTAKQLKNIVFLYVSIDKNEEIWKNAVEQNGLGEMTNGLVPGDWGSEIVKFFQINSIPRYMLIDKKGNIVDLNAKRPSDDAAYDDIIKLLE
jgi:thiol-disulfide isomerase/thioredoxin